MSRRVIKFSCHRCGQHIRAFQEHIGQNFPCPSCNSLIAVPEESENVPRSAEEMLVVERRFSEKELALIRREGVKAYESFIGGAATGYWQFALIADLFEQRMEPLRDSVLDILRQQAYHEGDLINHTPFVQFINQKQQEFFGALYVLEDRMTSELDRVIYQDDVSQIILFANQIGVVIKRLASFHDSIFEKPLPPVDPYNQLVGVMKSWAPFCWQSLNATIEELKSLSVHKRDDSSWKALQMSFAPPTLHEFFFYRRQLPEPEPELFEQ